MKNQLESQWLIYRDACYPPKDGKLPLRQEVQVRQAFFAGCLVVLSECVKACNDPSEEAAEQKLLALMKEAQTVCVQRAFELKGQN